MMILNLISGSGCGIEKIFPKDGMGGGHFGRAGGCRSFCIFFHKSHIYAIF